MQGKIGPALRFVEGEEGEGILEINDTVLEDLKAKHRETRYATKEALLNGPIDDIPDSYTAQ